MKTRPLPLAASHLTVLLAATSGCAKQPSTPPPVATDTPAVPVPPPTVPAAPVQLNPFEEMDHLLESATFAQHDGLTVAQVRLDRIISDRLAAWKSSGHSVSVEVDDKFTGVRRDFADKLRLLTLADETSWPNAKHNAEMGLQDVRSLYHGIMLGPGSGERRTDPPGEARRAPVILSLLWRSAREAGFLFPMSSRPGARSGGRSSGLVVAPVCDRP